MPSPFPTPIPAACAAAVSDAKRRSGRVIAVGTSVVRALESAARVDGIARAGDGVASGRIRRGTPLRVVDAIFTGVHQAGESHFELLRAFAAADVLERAGEASGERAYRAHEFGDCWLVERGHGADSLKHLSHV